MVKIRRLLLWATLGLLLILTGASIYGAFLGATRAQAFFNSPPLATVWVGLGILLILGIFMFRRLLRLPALLFIHVGCIAILIGGLWGSSAGHNFQNNILGRNIIPEGRMLISNASQNNRVYLKEDPNDIRELPFDVALDEFRMEYYPGKLHVVDQETGDAWAMAVEPNAVYELGIPHGFLHIAGVFENFRIREVTDPNGNPIGLAPYEDPGPGSNPALVVTITRPQGEVTRHYVFERHPGHTRPGETLHFQYHRSIKDYISELKIVDQGQVVAEKNIEVNKPLYYGGYHFYQMDYDRERGQFTVLSVIPKTGLNWVYFGYILLCAGIAWQCWFLSVPNILKKEAQHGS